MGKPIEVLNESVTTTADREGKYLTFMLAGEEYGIEIAMAREIIRMMQITSVPEAPDFIKGVINLRGKVMSVIDLILKFGVEATNYGKNLYHSGGDYRTFRCCFDGYRSGFCLRGIKHQA